VAENVVEVNQFPLTAHKKIYHHKKKSKSKTSTENKKIKIKK